MNIWRISCHGQSFPEANAADELSFNCIYSGRCPLGTVFLSAYVIRIDCYKSNTYLNTLIEEQKVVTSGTLFSKPEQDYLDYMLNMHTYSNGSDLRNKYCHGNNPIDEKVSESNYYQILKIMCLIIIKINDEFCKYC